MVGVPGRSKSCNTCKKRKIACSLEKPACLTCIKSSRVCTGYARERIFIQHQIPGRDSQKSPATEQPLRPPMVSDGLRIRQKDSGMSLLPKTKSDRSEISKRSRVVQENATKILSPDMRPLYRQQIFSEFLFHYAPGCNAAKLQHSPSHRRDDGTGAWLLIIPSLPDITPALETSLLAVTLAKLGRRCHDSVLVHESLQFYTQALWELQKALWDPKLMYRDETLAACMLLTAYEVTECPTQTVYAWANHMKGCARLVELRGPKSYSSDFSSGLFLTWRLGEIQQAIAERRATFLESPEWVKLPWNDIPKSHFHQLLDIMARLANGIEVGYQLFANPSQPPNPATLLPAVSGIIERCWISDARLRCFYQVFEKETPGPLHWPKLSTGDDRPGDDPKLGKVFPVAFHFTNRRTAHTCMLYWAACSILWSGMRYLYGVLAAIHSLQAVQNLEGSNSHDSSGLDSPIGFDISQLPPLEHREDTVPLARNICQSTEYMVEDSAGPVGPAYAVFALKVAIETFNDSPGCDRELKWAMAVMDKIAGAGVRIMSHIPEPITHHTFLPG